jgi:hypothetical protein
MKQTAVEWLLNNLLINGLLRLSKDENPLYKELKDQAKEMEKEQKAEDWQLGYDACEFYNDYDELQREPMKNPYRNKK